jgi:hypothetical protein
MGITLDCPAEFNPITHLTPNRALIKRYKVMKKRIKSGRDSVQRFTACFKIQRLIRIESRTAELFKSTSASHYATSSGSSNIAAATFSFGKSLELMASFPLYSPNS